MTWYLWVIAAPFVIISADDGDITPSTSADERFQPPRGVITLEDAAALALTHNPALKVFPWDVRIAEARALQASKWPNPELSFEIEDIRLSDDSDARTRTVSVEPAGFAFEREKAERAPAGFRESEFTLRISQLFELGGKRKRAVETAQRERDAAQWDYEIGRTNVLRDVARAYIAVVAGQERVAERRHILELAQRVEETTQARADAGKVSPIEHKRAAVQTTAAQIEFGRAERRLNRARIALAHTWGGTEPTFERVEGALHTSLTLPALDALLARSEENPDLKRWQYEIAVREAELHLAKAQRVPDLTATLGFVAAGVDDRNSRSFGLGPDGFSASRASTTFDDRWEHRVELEFSIPLPIFDRNQGGVEAAEHRVSKSSDARHVTLSGVRTGIADAYQSAMAAYDEMASLRETALPLAEENFDATRIGYDEGKFGYLEVLDVQRTLFELRIQLIEAYSAYHQAVVELERLVGAPLWPGTDVFGTSIRENTHD